MDDFIAVLQVSELLPGQMTWVSVDGARVLLTHVEDGWYALEDVCGHQRMALSRGRLDGHVVECPLHFACYDVRTGALLSGPMAADVPTYEVRVEGDTVYIKREPNALGSSRRAGRSYD